MADIYNTIARPEPALAERIADALYATGQIGDTLAQALKDEARRRFEQHRFFGHIIYTSLIARKPAD